MCEGRGCLLEAFERVPALLRPLEPTQLLRLQRCQRALQRLLPGALVRRTAAERFALRHFEVPWRPGTRLVQALNRCREEDVDACGEALHLFLSISIYLLSLRYLYYISIHFRTYI